LGEEYRPLSSTLCSFLDSSFTSSLLGPNVLLSTLFSNTLSRSSSSRTPCQNPVWNFLLFHVCHLLHLPYFLDSIICITFFRNIYNKTSHYVVSITPLLPLPFRPNISLCILFSSTLCLLSPLCKTDRASRAQNTDKSTKGI
jgi:hypothetical protein